MAEATTPQQLLTQLQDRRDELVQQAASYRSQAAAQRIRAQEWQAKYDGTMPNRRDPNDLAMVADANAQAANFDRLAADADAQIKIVDAQIVEAEKDIRKYNDGLADATSKGLTGEAANTAAQAHVEEAKAKATTQKVIAYVIGGLVVIAAIVYAWRYLKKKKAA